MASAIAAPVMVVPAFGPPVQASASATIQVQPRLIAQVQAQNPALYTAVEQFLTDLTTAIDSPTGLAGASATLSNDVQQILADAPSTTSQAATTLSGDVTTATTSGALTSSSVKVLSTDLTTVLTGALAPPSTSSGSGSGSGSSAIAAPATPASQTPQAPGFTNPNALTTALSDVGRAQDDLDASGTNTVDANTSTVAAPAKKAALGQLLSSLSGVFAKATTLAPIAKADLRADFVAISAVAHQPSAQAVTTLRNHVTQFTAGNSLTSGNLSTLTNDLSAVLTSAGVSSRLVDRTQVDLGKVLASPQVLPSDVGTILNDLTNVLINLPAASAVPSGPASWFLGKTPFGK